MSRFRFTIGFLAGMTIAISQTTSAIAKAVLSPSEIQKTAQPITVQVIGYGQSSSQAGSGVVIAKQGDTYAVLTNRHVVCALDLQGNCDRSLQFQVRTTDGQRYPISDIYVFEQVDGIPDVAVVMFRSPRNYSIATLGDSNQLKNQDLIWINGFPGRPNTEFGKEPLSFNKGFFSSRIPDPHSEGYTLSFAMIAAPGMSGSPIFDASGRVVAIFGQTGEPGFLSGISTNLVLELMKRSPVLAVLSPNVDRSTLTGTRPVLGTPRNAEDYFLRAVSQIERDQIQAALTDLSKAIELDPNLMIAYRSRAQLRGVLGDRTGALRDFDQVLRLDPDRTDALDARAQMRLQWNDLKGAIADFSEAIELDSQSPGLIFNRAMTYSRLENYQASVDDFTRGILLQPKDAVAYRERGRSYLGLQQLPKAIEDLNRSIQLDPNSAISYDLRCFVRLGMDDYRGALSDCNAAIKLNPNYALAYADRGYAWLGLNEPQKAIDDANMAIRLNPKFAEPYTVQAIAYERTGNIQRAIVAYESVIRLLKENGQMDSKAYQGITASIAQLRAKVK
ncbi:tetratricopeptide repeat protein [Pseudanabaenaceae cyanobacterium LEGE 13415]|nr:tetratricopeptide repeat protein [Pseudanabaenaceae cyanobacterium LEGE 13415]